MRLIRQKRYCDDRLLAHAHHAVAVRRRRLDALCNLWISLAAQMPADAVGRETAAGLLDTAQLMRKRLSTPIELDPPIQSDLPF